MRKKIEKLNLQLQHSVNRVLRLELNRVMDEYLDLTDRIKLSNPSYSSVMSIEPPALEVIQERIPMEGALVEFWLSERYSYVFLLTKEKLSVFPIDLKKSEIVRLVVGARNMIKYRVEDVLDQTLVDLYSALFSRRPPIYGS